MPTPNKKTEWEKEDFEKEIVNKLFWKGLSSKKAVLGNALMFRNFHSTQIQKARQEGYNKGQKETRCHYYDLVRRETRQEEREKFKKILERVKMSGKIKTHPCNCCFNPDNMADKRCQNCYAGDARNRAIEEINQKITKALTQL